MKTQCKNLTLAALMLNAGFDVHGAELQQASSSTSPTEIIASVSKIQFATPVYDFDKVINGEAARHEFILTNTGNALLKIKSVHASCDCITIGNWSHEVEPGKTGVIPVQFHAGQFNESVVKTIIVTSNAPKHPVTQLQVKATVWHPVEIDPPVAVLNFTMDTASNAIKMVHLYNNQESPITLSDPQSDSAHFVGKLETIKPETAYQLTVRAVPPFAVGTAHGVIQLKTSLTNAPVIKVPVFAVIRPAHPLAQASAPHVLQHSSTSTPVKPSTTKTMTLH